MYTSDSLKHIKAPIQHNIRYDTSRSSNMLYNLEAEGLIEGGKEEERTKLKYIKQQGIDHHNIIPIYRCEANTIIHPSENVKISSINIQSIKNQRIHAI